MALLVESVKSVEIKWTNGQYPVLDNSDVAHKYVRMYCNTNQVPALPFCGPYTKPHGARGVIKNYHLCFNPKLGNCVFVIRSITYVCVACTSIIYKPFISGIPSDKQEQYKPVTNCTYLPVLGPFKNWNIIHLSQKSTPYGAFDEIHQVVLYGISDNMALLVESVKYGSINTTYASTNIFYVIMFTPEAYTLQDNTTIDGKFITSGEFFFKTQYIFSMQVNTNWFWY